MIKEALGFLFDRGREAATIQHISLGRDKKLHLFPDGSTKEVERDNALISASIETPLSLCEAIRKFSWTGGGAYSRR